MQAMCFDCKLYLWQTLEMLLSINLGLELQTRMATNEYYSLVHTVRLCKSRERISCSMFASLSINVMSCLTRRPPGEIMR